MLDAADGRAALEVWDRSAPQADLLLTGMVMPGGMSGSAHGKTLQARKPQLKVICTSGYSPEIERENSLLAQDAKFLPIPYEQSAQLKAVRLCLDGGKLPRFQVCPPKLAEAVMALNLSSPLCHSVPGRDIVEVPPPSDKASRSARVKDIDRGRIGVVTRI